MNLFSWIVLSLAHIFLEIGFIWGSVDADLHLQFRTDYVPNEYIITFKRYYLQTTREKYINAALRNINISTWHLVSRSNLASTYPSDFEMISIQDKDFEWRVEHLSHPAIKRVSLQRSVQRNLNYIQKDNSTLSRDALPIYINRHILRSFPSHVTDLLDAKVLWNNGFTGKGVKVAVFDTGIVESHPHFRNVKERTNWTNEKSLDDGVSHGTYVTGIIASSGECLGFAPDAELYIFKVFTNVQVSYTSWFLDAFNYAIFRKINVLNLSIGGPDFLDEPFMEKILELSANKIIVVSAIGNDGPLYGTLNNPGDQNDVIGVGGLNIEGNIATFSSRGMTTWELPFGYGRLKPDVVTYGSQVKGSNIHGGCRSLSGTSVASPVVAGAIALIISAAVNKSHVINPASVKQIIIEGATKLDFNNMFEQGYGKLNILRSTDLLFSYVPKVTLSPKYIDFTENYMWPYSSQPLYCGSLPVIVNVTILNGISVSGKIINLRWHPYLDKNGHILTVAVSYSPIIWPWCGWMAVYIGVRQSGCGFEGIVKGHISLVVQSTSPEGKKLDYTVRFPLIVKVIPRPPKQKRILWDQFHNLQYPPGYIPHDNLKIKIDPLDWRGDHLHTNFRDMYKHLRNSGYYIDVLRMPYTCFNASEYGTLLIVDPEEEYFDEEILKFQNDIFYKGLNVIVFADWYNTSVMRKIKFYDENTHQWLIPDTGGANIPALNDLLHDLGISFSDYVVEGHYKLGEHGMYYATGTTLATFPTSPENIVIAAYLTDQGAGIIKDTNYLDKVTKLFPILGLFHVSQHGLEHFAKNTNISVTSFEENVVEFPNISIHLNERNPIINNRVLLNYDKSRHMKKMGFVHSKSLLRDWINNTMEKKKSTGRIAIMGDSNCLDSTFLEKPCFWLLNALLEFTMNSHKASLLQNLNEISRVKQLNGRIPFRLKNSNINKYSRVLESKNQFKKRTLVKCEDLNWMEDNPINSDDISSLTL